MQVLQFLGLAARAAAAALYQQQQHAASQYKIKIQK